MKQQQQKQEHSKIENNAIFHYYKEQHQKDQDNLAVFNKSFTISPNEKNEYLQNPQNNASSPVGPSKKTYESSEKKSSNKYIEQSKQNQQTQQNLKGKQNEYIQQNFQQTDQNNDKQQANLKSIQPLDKNNNQNVNLQIINQEKNEKNYKNKDNYYENIQQLPSINNQQNFNLKPKFSEQNEKQHDLNINDIQNNLKGISLLDDKSRTITTDQNNNPNSYIYKLEQNSKIKYNNQFINNRNKNKNYYNYYKTENNFRERIFSTGKKGQNQNTFSNFQLTTQENHSKDVPEEQLIKYGAKQNLQHIYKTYAVKFLQETQNQQYLSNNYQNLQPKKLKFSNSVKPKSEQVQYTSTTQNFPIITTLNINQLQSTQQNTEQSSQPYENQQKIQNNIKYFQIQGLSESIEKKRNNQHTITLKNKQEKQHNKNEPKNNNSTTSGKKSKVQKPIKQQTAEKTIQKPKQSNFFMQLQKGQQITFQEEAVKLLNRTKTPNFYNDNQYQEGQFRRIKTQRSQSQQSSQRFNYKLNQNKEEEKAEKILRRREKQQFSKQFKQQYQNIQDLIQFVQQSDQYTPNFQKKFKKQLNNYLQNYNESQYSYETQQQLGQILSTLQESQSIQNEQFTAKNQDQVQNISQTVNIQDINKNQNNNQLGLKSQNNCDNQDIYEQQNVQRSQQNYYLQQQEEQFFKEIYTLKFFKNSDQVEKGNESQNEDQNNVNEQYNYVKNFGRNKKQQNSESTSKYKNIDMLLKKQSISISDYIKQNRSSADQSPKKIPLNKNIPVLQLQSLNSNTSLQNISYDEDNLNQVKHQINNQKSGEQQDVQNLYKTNDYQQRKQQQIDDEPTFNLKKNTQILYSTANKKSKSLESIINSQNSSSNIQTNQQQNKQNNNKNNDIEINEEANQKLENFDNNQEIKFQNHKPLKDQNNTSNSDKQMKQTFQISKQRKQNQFHKDISDAQDLNKNLFIELNQHQNDNNNIHLSQLNSTEKSYYTKKSKQQNILSQRQFILDFQNSQNHKQIKNKKQQLQNVCYTNRNPYLSLKDNQKIIKNNIMQKINEKTQMKFHNDLIISCKTFNIQKNKNNKLNTQDNNNIHNETNYNTQQTQQKWTKFNPQQVFRPKKLEYTNFKVRSQSLGLELYLQTNNQYRELILTNH